MSKKSQHEATSQFAPTGKSRTTQAFPGCDWVYFATPSKESATTTIAMISELGMIIWPVYDGRNPPNAISNVRRIRLGQYILLAFSGQGEPYRPMLLCKVIAPPYPVSGFESISFADDAATNRIEGSGYTPDPHLKRFTGISVEAIDIKLSGTILKPAGNTTIRSWKEVEAHNPS
jgi:hypothetical protein